MQRGSYDPAAMIRLKASKLVSGALAGAVGTFAMDLVWYRRYRAGGGDEAFTAWEFSKGLDNWEQAPAPAKVGRLLAKTVFHYDIPPERIPAVSNLMHWVYGTIWSAQLNLVLPPRVWRGPAIGALVWSSGYVVLPALKIYKPIWQYDRDTLAEDLSAHLVFGAATDATLRLLPANRR
jgi:hypothetical protein